MVISTAHLHSTKPKLSFCAGLNPACDVSEMWDGEDLWQWFRLEIRLNAFHPSTIPQKQFSIIIIIIIIIIISNSYFFVIRVKIYKFKARNDKCWRECKDPGKHIGWKSCIWNPSTCTCESSKYQESSIGDTVIMCNKIIEAKRTY